MIARITRIFQKEERGIIAAEIVAPCEILRLSTSDEIENTRQAYQKVADGLIVILPDRTRGAVWYDKATQTFQMTKALMTNE